MSTAKKKHRHAAQADPRPTHELVDPVWMLKAILAVIILAAVCGYLAVCGLFYTGQWQLVLSPSRDIASTPSSVGLTFENLHFGPDAGGQPQLTGWWIPSTQPDDPVVLVLHGGAGSMSDALPQARQFHENHLSVFLFDYRGFGKSSGKHPTQQQMEQDSQAALQYLNDLRHVPNKRIIVFGEGLGASLATELCTKRQDLSALILENADGDFESRVAIDSRSRLVPVGLLFNQRFPLADPLHSLKTPKLLISFTKSGTPPVDFARASDPKLTVELGSQQDVATWSATLRRFLDSYTTTQPASLLVPNRP